MLGAYYRCLEAQDEKLECGLSLDPDKCDTCKNAFLRKYEKGVDVALAAQLVILGGAKANGPDRIILVAGDGDYQEAVKFCRRQVGRDVQIVSSQRALSSELQKLGNKPTIILDRIWKSVCQIRTKPPLEESPALEEDDSEHPE